MNPADLPKAGTAAPDMSGNGTPAVARPSIPQNQQQAVATGHAGYAPAASRRSEHAHPAPSGHSVFIPLVLFLSAWLLWSGFQSVQLLREHEVLRQLHANQQETVRNAQQMRQQLDALAAGTQRLADAGHPHATQLVAELSRRGITINP